MKTKLAILFTGFCLITYAQNSLYGNITNSKNERLFGVEIYAPKLHKGTTSNLDGIYTLKNLPNGTIEIVFSFIGYTSQVKTVTLDNNQQQLDIKLAESVFEMDEVIVSTPFNKLQSDNVMKVAHKNIEQLQKQGAPTLMQGLSSITGVSQISTGTNIGKPVIRGLSGNRVLVYTQGIRLENQQYGDEHGLGVNEAGIESVEVIKGPASLLYGSDALGGVLYLNPEKFAINGNTMADLSSKYFTNTFGSNTSFGFKTSAEKLKFLSRLTYNSHSDYKVPDGNRVTNTRYNEYDLKTGLGFDTANFSSEIRYNYTLSTIGIPEEIGEQSTSVTFVTPYQKIGNHILSTHNHFYLNNSSIDMNLGYIANTRKEFEEEDSEEALALYMKLKTFTYDVKYNLRKLKNFESIVGIQGLHQTNSNFGEELLIPDAVTNDVGIFATGMFSIENHTLQAGIRFDNRTVQTKRHETKQVFDPIDRSFNSFTSSLGYKTSLFKHITTRINLATGYRAPNLAELSSNGVHEGTNRFEIGNSNLTNEQNYQIDVALEYKNEHIEFYANGFYNAISDYIFVSPTNQIIEDANVFEYVQNNADLYGGEFGLHFHPHPLDWLHIESSFETVTGKQNKDEYLPLIPANQLNNTLRTEFKNTRWVSNAYASLKLETSFAQKKNSSFETSTDGYNLVHFALGGKVTLGSTKFDLNLNINNLLNTEYIAHLSRLKTDSIQNIGRNMVVSLSFNI